MKNNYRIQFLKPGRYGSDSIYEKDVYAKDENDAYRQAYAIADANSLRSKGCEEISVEEIPEAASPIGIQFRYTDTAFKRDFTGYVIIKAESERQARDYYNAKLKGTRFWFDEDEIDPKGKCIRGEIVKTYFAACPGYDFDATKEAIWA